MDSLIIVRFNIGLAVGADCTQKFVKVTPGGTILFRIRAEELMHNIHLRRQYDISGPGIASANSDSSLHVTDQRYTGRIQAEWARSHGDAIIKITNAETADGGNYFIVASGFHHKIKVCYQVYVVDTPTKPKIKMKRRNSSIVIEGEYAHLSCTSISTTYPNNPDWKLRYQFTFSGSNQSRDIWSRALQGENELMIAGVSMADEGLIITCTVWEENGIPMNASGSFILHVSVKNVSCDISKLASKRQEQQEEPGSGCYTTTVDLTVLALILVAPLVIFAVL